MAEENILPSELLTSSGDSPSVLDVENYIPEILGDVPYRDDDLDFSGDVSTEDEDDAQMHWDESMKQLEHAVFFVLCPIFGRLIGRRVAHNLWTRYVDYRWIKHLENQHYIK